MPDSVSTLTINIKDQGKLTAIFERAQFEQNSIVINEINYNSNEGFDTGDWVELYNRSNSTIHQRREEKRFS